MMDRGFEALADASLLLAVLLVASALVTGAAVSPPPLYASALRYAEDTRLALFRTTMDPLGYTADGEAVTLQNGTSVEAFLRLQVHLRARGHGDLNFSAANERIGGLAVRLVRPGWNVLVLGGVTGRPDLVSLPSGVTLPSTYAASGWTYPPIDGVGDDVRLSVAVWVNPLG